MNENAPDPRYGTPSGQPLNWAGQPGQPPAQPGQVPPAGAPGYGHPHAHAYAPPGAPPFGPPPGRYGPPPAYGPPGYWYPHGYAPGHAPAPKRRHRLVPAALALGLAGVVAAGAVVLNSGSVPTLSNPSGSGSSTTATPAGSVDYDTGVVNITTVLGGQNATAAGTGIILDQDGTILTNNHVVEDATTITVTDVNTGKQYSAGVVGTDENDDVAVIQLRNASGLTPASIGDSSSVKVGQKVVAIGNAGGGRQPDVVTGSVTALDQTITATDSGGANAETLNGLIEVNAPIVPGDSGGPLADSSGKVIGMNTAASSSQAAQSGSGFGSGRFGPGSGSSSGASEGYAIPIQSALTIAKNLESGSGSSGSSGSSATDGRGYLGVEVTDGSNGAGNANGPVVSGTVEGSPAASAGITAGSVIVAVDGQQISSASDLSSALQDSKAGQQINVSWVDSSGASHSATLTLMGGAA